MHALTGYTQHQIEERIDVLAESMDLHNSFAARMATLCYCDDFEVEGEHVVRDCPWNDIPTLEAELTRRELEAAR